MCSALLAVTLPCTVLSNMPFLDTHNNKNQCIFWSLFIQVNAIVLCSDGSSEPAAIAINAISAALMRSDIPWQGPISAVQFAHKKAGKGKPGDVIIQPSFTQLQDCTASGLYVGSADSVLLADFQVERQMQPSPMRLSSSS